MMDGIKEYIISKRFSILSYVCVIIHFHCGVIFTAITTALRLSEMEKFSCAVDTRHATHKSYAEKMCFLIYDDEYNSPVKFSAFVLFNFGSVVVVSVVYSLSVGNRIEEVERLLSGSDKPQTVAKKGSNEQGRKSFYVFNYYLFHLVGRSMLCILFTILQHTVLYPSGFDSQFSCVYPELKSADANMTPTKNANVSCTNLSARDKQFWLTTVSFCNGIFAIVALAEVIDLLIKRFPCSISQSSVAWSCDLQFINEYFLQEQYRYLPDEIELTAIVSSTQNVPGETGLTATGSSRQNVPDETELTAADSSGQNVPDETELTAADSSGQNVLDETELTAADSSRQNVPDETGLTAAHSFTQNISDETDPTVLKSCNLSSCDIYKQKVLKLFLTPDINYGSNKTSLDDLFIDFVIHTGQAPHKFKKEMTRHEIYDVYTKVPVNSIQLKEIKDLFNANEDTDCNVPSTILVIGRPGIGKTVLTRKIMRDWAKDDDEIYHNRVAFYFKFREFNLNEMQDITIKKFLQFGTELNEDEFESIFDEIWRNPQNAIFVFDGLDEFCVNFGNFQHAEAQSKKYSNKDVSCPMSAMSFFVKILYGDMLPGATVLVTSRPTVNDVLCKLHFDRTVEIIGFTSDKIEQYVKQFCANHNRCDLEATLLNHIKSSSELMHLCYIPVNCFIVCVSLFKFLIDSKGDIGALPTTLTELYKGALVYFNKYHDRNESKEEVLKKLQELAFNGMKKDELIFNGSLIDEKMKESGLLNSLSKPSFQIQIQVCFIHLTIQEFLAAKHIVETKTPEDLKKFIFSYFEHGRWHLVLQFLAGLLGVKMKTSHEYRSCFFVLNRCLPFRVYSQRHVSLFPGPNELMMMKCLKEMQDEDIAEEIVATSVLNPVTKMSYYRDYNNISSFFSQPNDLTAVVFLCKHMKVLNSLSVHSLLHTDCLLEIIKLLQGRCMKSVTMYHCRLGDLGLERLGALLKSECQVNLENSKHTTLSHKCSKLTKLSLSRTRITAAGMAHVLDDQVYNQLTDLKLSENAICDEGVRVLSIAMQERQLKLKTLILASCSLTSESIPWLVKFLGNEHCGLRTLDLRDNAIKDEGVHVLCCVLGKESCNLTELTLSSCSLTEKCMSTLCSALDEEHCGLRTLDLSDNAIKDEGVDALCGVLGKETCNLTDLNLSSCSLTKKCMSTLCVALDEEHCGLRVLDLGGNDLGDESVGELCHVLQKETCHLTKLTFSSCSLTDECMPILCQTLGDERCKLTELDVSHNGFTDKHVSLLADALKLWSCFDRLDIERNNISKEGVRLLNEASGRRGLGVYGWPQAGNN